MPNTLACLYKDSLSLLTDLYQLTMAYGYWQIDRHEEEAVFNLIFRRNPFQGGYALNAGLATAIEYLQNWHFNKEDLAYLATLKNSENLPLFDRKFLQYLRDLKFSCDVDAIEEGIVVFPQEPLLRVKGPLLQCQLIETVLLNILHFQTLVATKATRVCYAAQGDSVLDFGLRRAQGIDGGISASRAAYIGGCDSTSNVLAGKLYGIPVRGTHAHSWIMAFPTELEAFQTYAKALPDNGIFLVDTYDTLTGVKHAISVGKWLQQHGHKLLGVRLDSGDLVALSIAARKLLDAAGFHDAVIVGSGDLDEFKIAELKQQGAAITVWGVGTRLLTGHDQPALDVAYKLAAIRETEGDWRYTLKLSATPEKTSAPGILRVRRYFKNSCPAADVIYDEEMGVADQNTNYTELMKPIFHAGKCVYKIPTLSAIREKARDELNQFADNIRQLHNAEIYPVKLEGQLMKLKEQLIYESLNSR